MGSICDPLRDVVSKLMEYDGITQDAYKGLLVNLRKLADRIDAEHDAELSRARNASHLYSDLMWELEHIELAKMAEYHRGYEDGRSQRGTDTHYWTKREVDALRRWYPEYGPHPHLWPEPVRRSDLAVKRKATRLGVRFMGREPTTGAGGEP